MPQQGSPIIKKDINGQPIPRWLYERLRSLGEAVRGNTSAVDAIVRGENPDGTGDPIVDLSQYFFLPGRSGGQLAHGANTAGGRLILSSTSHSTKGTIYFGDGFLSGYDDVNTRLGLGTSTPAATLHLIASLEGGASTFLTSSDVNVNWAGPYSGPSGTSSPGPMYVAISADDDDGQYIAINTFLPNGVNRQICGLDGVISPNRIWTINAKVRTFSPNVLVTGSILAFRLVDSAGNRFTSANIDLTGIDSNWTLVTVTLDATSGGTVAGTANSLEIDATGAADYVLLSYVEVVGGGTNIARWDTSSVQTGRITVDGYLESRRLIFTGNTSGTLTHQVPSVVTSYSLTWPAAQGAANTFLKDDGTGILSWALVTNPLLDGANHTDTVAATVAQGALIIGNATPAWDRLLIGPSGTVLTSNGTTATWAALPATTNNLLDGANHLDTVAQGVSRGSLIVGNATPLWDELVLGAAGGLLQSNGTDLLYATTLTGNYTFTSSFCQFVDGLTLTDSASAGTVKLLCATAGTANTIEFPTLDGVVALTTGAQTFNSKTLSITGNTLKCNTATSGVSFTDNTAATKVLRMVLSGAVGNNSFVLVNTAARTYTFGNDTGNVDLIVAPTSATVDKTGQTASIGATTTYTTTHAGFYRMSAYWVFTAVTLAGTLAVSALFTDPQQAQTEAVIPATAFGAAGDNASGRYTFYATSGTTIQFSTTLVNTGTYNVYIRVESLT